MIHSAPSGLESPRSLDLRALTCLAKKFSQLDTFAHPAAVLDAASDVDVMANIGSGTSSEPLVNHDFHDITKSYRRRAS